MSNTPYTYADVDPFGEYSDEALHARYNADVAATLAACAIDKDTSPVQSDNRALCAKCRMGMFVARQSFNMGITKRELLRRKSAGPSHDELRAWLVAELETENFCIEEEAAVDGLSIHECRNLSAVRTLIQTEIDKLPKKEPGEVLWSERVKSAPLDELRSFFGSTLDENNLDLLEFVVRYGTRHQERKVLFKGSQRALARKLVELEDSGLLIRTPSPRSMAQWAADFMQYQGDKEAPTDVKMISIEDSMRQTRREAK